MPKTRKVEASTHPSINAVMLINTGLIPYVKLGISFILQPFRILAKLNSSTNQAIKKCNECQDVS